MATFNDFYKRKYETEEKQAEKETKEEPNAVKESPVKYNNKKKTVKRGKK